MYSRGTGDGRSDGYGHDRGHSRSRSLPRPQSTRFLYDWGGLETKRKPVTERDRQSGYRNLSGSLEQQQFGVLEVSHDLVTERGALRTVDQAVIERER